jgi:hypothetical protein
MQDNHRGSQSSSYMIPAAGSAAPQQQNQHQQPFMIPAQSAAPLMVPVHSAKPVMVPAQQAQPMMIPAQPGPPNMIPAQQPRAQPPHSVHHNPSSVPTSATHTIWQSQAPHAARSGFTKVQLDTLKSQILVFRK